MNASLLRNKRILLGVSGSIAAYKAVDWARMLIKEDASVQVVMTGAATRFVSPLTFAALTGNRVFSDMFDPGAAEEIPHISLAKNCDLVLVAPATAQTIGRLAHGLADDLLSTVLLATKAKVVLCPAMNGDMYTHPATQANLTRLHEFGYQVVEPDSGLMACGDEGPGRLPEWDAVRRVIMQNFSPQDLEGYSVLVTAGPTHEPIDPVRFISNRSTGKMGYALAETARQRGARVTLVTGPVDLPAPHGIELVRVTTADEMHKEVMDRSKNAHVVVKAAAVSDYRPAEPSLHKIKKHEAGLELAMLPNRDILKELGQRKKKISQFPVLVGFAAESRDLLEEGRRKLEEKNLDLIAVNDITASDAGFAVNTNRIILLDRDGGDSELPLLSKEDTAHRIWDRVGKILAGESHP